MSKILLFGGTTEGKRAAAALDSMKMRYFYSTKNATDFSPSKFCEYRYGDFDGRKLLDFTKRNKIKLIIDASHPFADRLHKTVAGVSGKTGIPVIRYERKRFAEIKHRLVNYCDDYESAIEKLAKKKSGLLILTGVQTLELLKPLWENNKNCHARILPRKQSFELAAEQGFPKDRLIAEMPGSCVEKEKKLLAEMKIKSVITKESGESGKQDIKIKAAVDSGAEIFIVKRPPVPDFSFRVYSPKKLAETIRMISDVS